MLGFATRDLVINLDLATGRALTDPRMATLYEATNNFGPYVVK